jgi:hypothetical protein
MLAIGFLVLCFSPWVYFVTKAARANPTRVNFVWNRPPPVSELIGYYANLNGPLSYRWKVFGTAIVLLVFLGPVVAWTLRAIKRGRDEKESLTFRWLAMFAFAPVVLAFFASHVLPEPVWAFRYLIISAPAYLLMVAVAAFKLKRPAIRIGAVALMLGWASLSGFAEMTNRDKIAWQPLVQKMIQVEQNQTGAERAIDAKPPGFGLPSSVYVFDANVGNTIQFYLDAARETRLQTAFVGDLSSVEGDHFWIALIRYKHEYNPLPQTTLSERGYVVGEAIESEAPGHKSIIFPVWKDE